MKKENEIYKKERNVPQLTRTGYLPSLKSWINDFRSKGGVPECRYRASTPPRRNVLVRSLICAMLTQNINVDFRVAAQKSGDKRREEKGEIKKATNKLDLTKF